MAAGWSTRPVGYLFDGLGKAGGERVEDRALRLGIPTGRRSGTVLVADGGRSGGRSADRAGAPHAPIRPWNLWRATRRTRPLVHVASGWIDRPGHAAGGDATSGRFRSGARRWRWRRWWWRWLGREWAGESGDGRLEAVHRRSRRGGVAHHVGRRW